MKSYYKILLEFSNGTTPCRNHLIKRHGEEILNEIIELGYIVKIRETDIGDPVYQITEKGRELY